MKILKCLIAAIAFYSTVSLAHEHNHPPHNMILLGTNEIFVSHIVYKAPHNYQVILQVELDSEAKQIYLKSKSEHPDELHIFLLDSMDIKDIATQASISGKILIEDKDGKRLTLLEHTVVQKDHFKVIYFDELPLSLEAKPAVSIF